MRTLYVRLVRAARAVARATGLLAALERSSRPSLQFIRTLFAVYDARDMAHLDLPWWSYASIAEVEAHLASRPDAKVFEFGAGASTAWLARRAASVHSVEHDPDFISVAREIAAPFDHVCLAFVPARRPEPPNQPRVTSERQGAEGLDFADYVAAVERADGPFDLIVIDGRARVECLRRALPCVARDGLIVFDDVERARYAPALTMPDIDVRVLRGRTPAMPLPTSTALLRPRSS